LSTVPRSSVPIVPLHQDCDSPDRPTWVGLMIGNSRLHWGAFVGERAIAYWHSDHRQTPLPIDARQWGAPAALQLSPDLPLVIASVVPAQTDWVIDRASRVLQLADIPIPGLYASLGIDRALGLWRAGQAYGWPVLVIDGGTALTLTAADRQGRFWGGAILPGLQLQLRSLGQTGQLPRLDLSGRDLSGFEPTNPTQATPPRWAHSTEAAIASGLYYGLQATLASYSAAWRQAFADGTIVVTGGDAGLLREHLGPSVNSSAHLVVAGLGHIGAGLGALAWAGGSPRVGDAQSTLE
jgi:type III pantothenate kinase